MSADAALTRASVRTEADRFAAYLLALVIIVAAALLAGAAANLIVDPYRLARGGSHHTFPPDLTFEREVRFNMITARHPAMLFMGASQVAIGIDPDDPLVPVRGAFNAAIDGGTLSEDTRLLAQAIATGTVKRVVLGISYNMTGFVGPDHINALFLDDGKNPLRRAEAFLSATMLRSTAKALIDGIFGRPSDIKDNGQLIRAVIERQVRGHGSVRAAFDALSLPNTGHLAQSAASLRAFLATACRGRAAVTIMLLPDHAVNLEVFAAAGQWNAFKQWKRDVVALASHAACPVRTIDFEDYNTVTTEPLPPVGSLQRMKYYWDPGHFTQATGTLILARLFAATAPVAVPAFGEDLSPANVAARLQALDTQRLAYETAHRPEMARIAAVLAAGRQ